MWGYSITSGSSQANTAYSNTYSNLPKHTMIYFTLSLWAIDAWQSSYDYFQVKFDTRTFNGWGNWDYSNFPSAQCGYYYYNDLTNGRIFGRVSHSALSLTFNVISQLRGSTSTRALGFRNLNFLFVRSPTSAGSTETMCGKASISTGSLDCYCNEGAYYSSALGYCVSCTTGCLSCFGSGLNQCYQCASGYGWDRDSCVPCTSNCISCIGTSVNECIACQSGYLLVKNGTCIPSSSCAYPLATTGCSRYCDTCPDGKFLDWTGTCVSTCDLPLQQEVKPTTLNLIPTATVCKFPCSNTQTLYWDGSCQASCSAPFTPRTDRARYFCDFPCPANKILYWDGSCKDTCDFPLVQEIIRNRVVCKYPCYSADYLYPNGTCLDHCNYAYTPGTIAGKKLCTPLCLSPKRMFYDGSCIETCNHPYRVYSDYTGDYCMPPCGINEYFDQETGTCVTHCGTKIILVDKVYLKCLAHKVTYVKLIHSIRYLDIVTPPKLQRADVIRGTNILSIRVIPGMFSWIKMTSQVPSEFRGAGVQTAFITNFLDDLVLLAILIASEIVFSSTQFIIGRHAPAVKSFIGKIQILSKFNLPLMLIATNVGDIIFFSIIQFRTFDRTEYGAITNLVIAILMVVISALLIGLTSYLVYRAKKAKTIVQKDGSCPEFVTFANKWRNFQVLFGGYSCLTGLSESFFLIYTIRIALPMIIASALFMIPLLQAVLYVAVNLGILVYLFSRRPIKSKISLLNVLVVELVMLMINVSVFILTYLNLSKNDHDEYDTTRTKLGRVIIIGAYIIYYMAPLFLVAKIIDVLVRVYKQRSKGTKKDKSLILQPLFLIFQQGFMGFEEVSFEEPKLPSSINSSSLETSQIHDISVDKEKGIARVIARQSQRNPTMLTHDVRKRGTLANAYDHILPRHDKKLEIAIPEGSPRSHFSTMAVTSPKSVGDVNLKGLRIEANTTEVSPRLLRRTVIHQEFSNENSPIVRNRNLLSLGNADDFSSNPERNGLLYPGSPGEEASHNKRHYNRTLVQQIKNEDSPLNPNTFNRASFVKADEARAIMIQDQKTEKEPLE